MFGMGMKAFLGMGAASLGARAAGGLSKFAATSIGKRTLTGAAIGGAYGLGSDNTSVLGGALMGAGIGAGSRGAWSIGKAGYGGIMSTTGAGARASAGFRAMGTESKRMFGQHISPALGKIKSTLKGYYGI